MVVVAVEAEEQGCGAAGWGTWEELVLGGAVQRHGPASWHAVAAELRSRSPASFSPEECEAKFSEIQARYSASNAWFDELRKQRVAELRRELRKSESFIGSLQSVIESLSNSKRDDSNSGCHTESRSRNEIAGDTNSSSKELSKDRSSAASFTEEASNSQKSQNVQNTSAETLSKPLVEKKPCAKDCLLWGSRKKRGLREKRAILMADNGSRDGENTSTCIQREDSSEGCKKGLKIPKVEPAVSVCERAKPSLADIVNSISTQGDCNMLQRQIDIQRKRARYKKMIRQHMDFRILRTKIKSGLISSTKELLKDMLLFVNNVLAFYPKATLEHMAAIELRGIMCKTLQQSSSIVSMGCGAPGVATGPVIKKTAVTIASDTVIKKTTAGGASNPVIKKTTAVLASNPVAKKAAAGISNDPVIKKTVAGIARDALMKKGTAGMARDPVMKKAVAGIASEPVTKKAAAGITSEPVIKKAATGIASEPVMKKAAAGIASEPVIKKAAEGIASEPAIKKTAAGVASAPVVKKIARTLPAVRHVPRDAKRSKVLPRDTGSSASQAEPKVVPSDAAPTSNEKPDQGSPPAKKRGVGRPPKSGQKRAAEQQESPGKGRKKARR
ncbi:uncharacterized protein [Lolium perenne]|uniref:uncharacterized protein n=1 Tax=Lolium perenne TaxID=4522 RepID=UPI0021F5F7FB|nr:uncharacterized protein LOC127333045 isoform X1 [Lolium perenne]